MKERNINWGKVRNIAAGIAAAGIIWMILDCIRAKAKYYRKAAKLMDKTDIYMDKTMKMLDDTMN